MQPWVLVTVSAVAGIALGGVVLYSTPWFKIRKYAIDLKRTFDKHKIQQKVEAVQAMGENPNPVLIKKPLRDVITEYQALLADLEKIKAPKKAKEIHTEQIAMHRESMSLYQAALVGGFRQKSLQDKQKKLMAMERSLQGKMEKVFGKPREPKQK